MHICGGNCGVETSPVCVSSPLLMAVVVDCYQHVAYVSTGCAKKWGDCLTAYIFKMPEPMCDIFGKLKHCVVLNTFVKSILNKKLCYGRGIARRACQYRKVATNERPWHTPKVITVTAIKWPYGISLSVCGTVVSTSLYKSVFKTLPLLKWTWLPVTLRTPSFLTTKLKLQATCPF